MRKIAQNNLSNGGPDAALEGALHEGTRRVRGRERRILAKSVINCFSDAIFSSKCMQGRLGIKKTLLISVYILQG